MWLVPITPGNCFREIYRYFFVVSTQWATHVHSTTDLRHMGSSTNRLPTSRYFCMYIFVKEGRWKFYEDAKQLVLHSVKEFYPLKLSLVTSLQSAELPSSFISGGRLAVRRSTSLGQMVAFPCLFRLFDYRVPRRH